jgi:hypothetical protein
MGLIKEPAEVDFTTISNIWAAKEEKEFSELIKKQKKVRNAKTELFFNSFSDNYLPSAKANAKKRITIVNS